MCVCIYIYLYIEIKGVIHVLKSSPGAAPVQETWAALQPKDVI